MNFKAGDRVHVTRLNHNDVDFYATLVDVGEGIWELTYCSDDGYQYDEIYKNDSINFGKNQSDYYTLATDEEDSEEPEVQHINDKNYLNTQFVVEVNKGVYVQKIKGNLFKFTKNIEEALFFSYYFENLADDIVEQLNGKKYEVVRYMEG